MAPQVTSASRHDRLEQRKGGAVPISKVDLDPSSPPLVSAGGVEHRHIALSRVRFAPTCTILRIPIHPDHPAQTPWIEFAALDKSDDWVATAEADDDDDDDWDGGYWDIHYFLKRPPAESPRRRKQTSMSGHWSSAATGKPQLSYADRLRKAKEDAAASKPSEDKAALLAKDVPEVSSSQAAPRPTPLQLSREPSALDVGRQTVQSLLPSPPASGTRASTPAASGAAAEEGSIRIRHAQSNEPIHNVWEIRRQQQALKDQEMESAASSIVAAESGSKMSNSPDITHDVASVDQAVSNSLPRSAVVSSTDPKHSKSSSKKKPTEKQGESSMQDSKPSSSRNAVWYSAEQSSRPSDSKRMSDVSRHAEQEPKAPSKGPSLSQSRSEVEAPKVVKESVVGPWHE